VRLSGKIFIKLMGMTGRSNPFVLTLRIFYLLVIFRGESTCETSSFDSECQDDMEIALAMQAAEIASRNEVRARFK
jgi:hypothetical protein